MHLNKRLAIVLLIVMFFLIILQPASAVQESSSVPYIYYYSPEYMAFMIEKADGTDQRILGDGLMPRLNGSGNYIRKTAWSPSGEWFAWTTGSDLRNYFSNNYRTFVIRSDGSQNTGGFHANSYVNFEWAPDEDLLFAVVANALPSDDALPTGDGEVMASTIHLEFKLVDLTAETTAILWEENLIQYSDYYRDYDILWSEDAQHIVISSGYGTQGWLVDRSGHVTSLDLSGFIPSIAPDSYNYGQRQILATFQFLHSQDDTLRLENIISQEYIDFPNVPATDAYWTQDAKYALLSSESGLWFLDITENTLQVIDEAFSIQLPGSIVPPSIWSPGGDNAIVANTSGQIFQFNRQSQSLTLLDISFDSTYNSPYWYWFNDEQAIVTGDFVDRDEVALVSIYDFENISQTTIDINSKLDTLPETVFYRFNPNLVSTSDGRHLTFVGDGAISYDVFSDTVHAFSPNYDSYFSVDGGELFIGDNDRWQFVHEDALVAGGGFYRNYSIINVDNTFHRQLPTKPYWLPTHVIPDQLPPQIINPITPEPMHILEDNQWNFYVSWSPDGQKIACGLDLWFGGETALRLWDLETNTVSTAFEQVESDQRVDWELDEDLSYIPTLVTEQRLPDFPYGPQVVSPDKEQIVVLTPESSLEVYSYENNTVGEEIIQLTTNRITSVAYSPDGTLLALGSQWNDVEIWDTQTWTKVLTLPNGGAGLAFSPDGRYLAVAISWDIQIWEVAELLSAI